MSASLFIKPLYTIGLTIWVVFSIIAGQTIAVFALDALHFDLNPAVQTTIESASWYVIALVLAVGVPILVTRKKIAASTLGIAELPTWSDIGLSLLAVVPYYILSGILLWLGSSVLRVIDPQVGQEVAFSNLTQHVEYIVAFITLVIMAPVAEELLFRGYFLGRLSERINKWAAVVVVAIIFSLMHLIGADSHGHLVLQWAAAFDIIAFGLVAGVLRIRTGRIWAGVLLHAVKNAVAFYFLFVAPLPTGGM